MSEFPRFHHYPQANVLHYIALHCIKKDQNIPIIRLQAMATTSTSTSSSSPSPGLNARAQKGFAKSHAYDQHRPSYSASSVQFLLEQTRVSGRKHARVVDLAAGTGKFTELLAGREEEEFEILAVEPHEQMREVLASKQLKGVTVMEGMAHDMSGIEDESVDAVFVAQVCKVVQHTSLLQFHFYTFETIISLLLPQSFITSSNQQVPSSSPFISPSRQTPQTQSPPLTFLSPPKQAFHWFATKPSLQEIHRILRPHGVLGLIWNAEDYNAPRSHRASSSWETIAQNLVWSVSEESHDTVPRYRHLEWKNIFDAQVKKTPLSLLIASGEDQMFSLPVGEVQQEEGFAVALRPEEVWERFATLGCIAELEGERRERVKRVLMEAIRDDADAERDGEGKVVVHGYTHMVWTSKIPREGREELMGVQRPEVDRTA